MYIKINRLTFSDMSSLGEARTANKVKAISEDFHSKQQNVGQGDCSCKQNYTHVLVAKQPPFRPVIES